MVEDLTKRVNCLSTASAEWEYEHGSWQCSECGHAPNIQNYWDFEDGKPGFRFCPNCGAKMDEE